MSELAVAAGLGESLALLVQMLAIIALFGVGTWLALRALGKWQGRTTSRGLEVLARCGLDTRNTLYVVRAGERVLLLGAGPNGVATLAELDAADLEALGLHEGNDAPAEGFLALLRRSSNEGDGKSTTDGDA